MLGRGNYSEAYTKYTEAIKVAREKDTAVLYCNRAQACLLLRRWEDARYDAVDALVADPNYHKAWLRLGRAYDGMKDRRASARAYTIGCQQAKDNMPLMRALDEAVRESRMTYKNTADALPPCEAPSDLTRAALSLRLKGEGIAQFANRASDPNALLNAYMKFTLALAFDRSSADLYCNRAYICELQEKWGDAIEDAEMAIHVDSEHIRAYWRLATAHLGANQLIQSLEAITGAHRRIAKISGPLSPADEKLHNGICDFKNDIEARLRRASGLQANQIDAPWILAEQYLVTHSSLTIKDSWYTSAWPMRGAYKDFSTGVALLYQTKMNTGPELRPGQKDKSVVPAVITGSDCIVPVTNGLLSDMRSFHVARADLSSRIKTAILLESNRHHAFKESEPSQLLKAVKARLRQTNGWGTSSVRPVPTQKSVATTIRIWILQAIIAWKIDEAHERACTLFRASTEFIELGRREWATQNSRGVIFGITFLLIIERAYLECCMDMFMTRGYVEALGSSTTLETIKAIADKILAQMGEISEDEKTPQPNPAAPDCITYMVYPEAVAHDAIALYYRMKAHEATSPDEEQKHLSMSIESLTKSIALYPTDEELRCEALYHLLDCMFRTREPLAKILPLCDALAVSVRASRDIWRASTLSRYGDAPRRWYSLLSFAEDAKQAVARKKLSLQDVVTPATLAAAIR